MPPDETQSGNAATSPKRGDWVRITTHYWPERYGKLGTVINVIEGMKGIPRRWVVDLDGEKVFVPADSLEVVDV